MNGLYGICWGATQLFCLQIKFIPLKSAIYMTFRIRSTPYSGGGGSKAVGLSLSGLNNWVPWTVGIGVYLGFVLQKTDKKKLYILLSCS